MSRCTVFPVNPARQFPLPLPGAIHTLALPAANGPTPMKFTCLPASLLPLVALLGLLLVPATAVAQPPSVTVSPAARTVLVGESATFTATAGGAHPLAYQWRKNGNSIPGATTATLQLTNIPLSDNGSVFTIAVTNTLGTAVSSPVILSVVSSFSILIQPANVTVNSGATATFTVLAEGASMYVWQKNGIPIPGAVNASYTTPPTTPVDNGSTFRVMVFGPTGSLLSSPATLTVRSAPVITRQPANGGVNAGQTLASPFSVEATGTAPITFQWFKNGTAIPGATGSTYLPPPAVPADNGSTFSVVVTDAAGSVESTGANLTVRFGAVVVTHPANQAATPGGTATFTVVATGNPAPTFQWQRLPAGGTTWADLPNNATYSGANTAALTILSASNSMNGDQFRAIATVIHNGAILGAAATSNAASLAVKQNQSITFGALSDIPFTTSPIPLTATATSGLPVGFTVVSGPAAVSGNTLTLTAQGTVTVRATQPGDATFHAATPVERTFLVSGPVNPARLANLSIRATAGSEAQTLIIGFTIGGAGATEAKPLLIRGAGPALGAFGVSDSLADPVLSLFEGSTMIATNDDWGNDPQVVSRGNAVGAFAFASGSRDSALLSTIAPRGYTVQLTGKAAANGVALVEVYDTSATFTGATPRLTNVSARTQVGTGGNILITGFVVGGSGTRRVLVRAAGPALANFGLSGVLADPRLEIFQSVGNQSVKLAENDDWDAATAAAQQSVGAFAFPAGSKDAVLVATLEPGGYTAQVTGVNSTTGIALVEIYELP